MCDRSIVKRRDDDGDSLQGWQARKWSVHARLGEAAVRIPALKLVAQAKWGPLSSHKRADKVG